MNDSLTNFDPFEQGKLNAAFVAASVGLRPTLLCRAVRTMADGLKGISIVADLASADRASYIHGLRMALGENPKNLTAARALIWLFVRESLFQEARKCYSDIEQHWPNYSEVFFEHTRTLVVSEHEEAALFFEKHKLLFKGAASISYELQTARGLSNDLVLRHRQELLDLGAKAFRDMLIGRFDNSFDTVKQGEKKALWRMVEILANSNTIALVGNAPTLLGNGQGEKIDSFDVVIRCNFPTVDGFERDVGGRTDIVFFNETLRERLPTMRDKSPRFLATLSIGLHPEPMFGLPTHAQFDSNELVGTLPPVARSFLSDVCYSRCTTGLMVINFILFVLNKKVALFGFDFFSDAARAHYFGPQAGAYLGHELQYERWFVTNFLSEKFEGLIGKT